MPWCKVHTKLVSAGLPLTPTAMPEGAKVLSAESWGISAWTKTAKISVVFPDGRRVSYFLKVTIIPPITHPRRSPD
jgi:hypothetical protein